MTHGGEILQEPDYVPSTSVDNRKYEKTHGIRATADGRTLDIGGASALIQKHYHANMAAYLLLGDWLDKLRENGVYDNTKIIVTADHGYYLFSSDELDLSDGGVRQVDAENFFPLLLVKDFGATGFTTDDEFMTNADVPTIACEDVIEDPVNPFTGNPINSDEKTAHDQFIMTYHTGWDTKTNNGYTFLPTPWAAVTNNIWDRDDWELIDEPTVLTEHKIP